MPSRAHAARRSGPKLAADRWAAQQPLKYWLQQCSTTVFEGAVFQRHRGCIQKGKGYPALPGGTSQTCCTPVAARNWRQIAGRRSSPIKYWLQQCSTAVLEGALLPKHRGLYTPYSKQHHSCRSEYCTEEGCEQCTVFSWPHAVLLRFCAPRCPFCVDDAHEPPPSLPSTSAILLRPNTTKFFPFETMEVFLESDGGTTLMNNQIYRRDQLDEAVPKMAFLSCALE